MSDPIPSATPDQPSTSSTSAEDRKAAAALSSLNTTEVAASSGEPAASAAGKQPSSADQEALGKAMSRLEIAAGKSGGKTSVTGKGKDGESENGSGEVKKRVAAVKVSGEDVTLLVCSIFHLASASASITLGVG
ncbi:hypothetical protein BDV19DRAFT_360341 [Aspergillus venezuelensis]